MNRSRISRFYIALFLLLPMGGLTGCKVTMEKVEKWKKNSDTARLKKCLADKKQKKKVRVAAGLALFELGRYYGVEVMLERVKKRSKKEAQGLAIAMMNNLLPKLKGTDEAAVRAKDGLFSLWASVDEANQTKLQTTIITWLLENWDSVSHAGEHSAKKIFEKLGTKAGKVLAEKLTLSHNKLYELATHVGEIAAPEDKEKLVKRFVTKLDKNPQLLARADRLYSIGKICSKTSLLFLQRKAVKAFNFSIRRNALIGLRLCPHPSSIQPAIATLKELQSKALKNETVALPKFKDKKPGVIHQAFEVLDVIKDWKKTQPGLTELLTMTGVVPLDKKNKRRKLLIRTKAGQYFVFLGKVPGLKVLLQKLPDDEWPGGYILALRKAVLQQFSKKGREEALKVLREAAKGTNWVGKAVAIESLGHLGDKKKDAAILEKAKEDKTPLKGWGTEGVTIGERAAIALKRLRSR